MQQLILGSNTVDGRGEIDGDFNSKTNAAAGRAGRGKSGVSLGRSMV